MKKNTIRFRRYDPVGSAIQPVPIEPIEYPDRLCHFCKQMVKYENWSGTTETCTCDGCNADYEGSQSICIKCDEQQ